MRDHLGIRSQGSEQRTTESPAAVAPDASLVDVSPEFLAALPSDIQEEVGTVAKVFKRFFSYRATSKILLGQLQQAPKLMPDSMHV